jgi:hypothetical protein
MAAVLDREDPETAYLEERALKRMARVLCEHIECLAREARLRGELRSREAQFQLEVFAERRAQAEQVLQAESSETCEIRISRLQKLVEALDCSRSYFRVANG